MNITEIIHLIPLIRPEYQDLAGHLVSILLLVSILYAILKVLQAKEMKALFQGLKEFGKSFLKQAAAQLTLPTKYPCIEFISSVAMAIVDYLMFLTFFALSMLFGVMAILSDSATPSSKTMVLFVSGLVLIAARFFFAEGERTRIALPTLWAVCRSKPSQQYADR